MNDRQALLRRLPSVDSLLAHSAMRDLARAYGRDLVVDAIRAQLAAVRLEILNAEQPGISEESLRKRIAESLRQRQKPTLREVINATGVIIHTNLGRAPLSVSAREAIVSVACSYSSLEFNLDTGARGSRQTHALRLLRDLTGAEDALVVNNNASALILILSALAKDREVIISRGQLVEIGGGFRIPAIMRESGAGLVEVGTTNRTRIADYEAALTDDSAMLLRVHTSNFKQIGFVQQPTLEELTALAHARGLLAVDDLGSGTLIDTGRFGLEHEPMIQESVAAGLDLVCFSGDKLLGGPQAGIIVGKAEALAPLKRHPLARAMRVDKLTYAALIATLEHYQRGDALERIPVWQMVSCPLDDIKRRATKWAAHIDGTVVSGESTLGGGSLPGASLPTALLAIRSAAPNHTLEKLRAADPPVIARIADGRVLLDPRTVLPEQEAALLAALKTIN